MLPLLHAGWRRGRAVASGLRHPYQVRRLRSVFGSGRACRNSCDFRTAVIPATRRGAGRLAQPTRDSRHSPPGHPRLYRSRQAPAIAPVACSRRMPLSHHGHRGRATASPALYHAPPPNPTFLPHRPVPAIPNSPAPPPGSRRRFPWNAMTPNPLRPNAVDPRFHYVRRPAPCARRPAAGRPATHSAQPTRAKPECHRTNAEPEPKPSATSNSRQTFSHSQ